MHGQILTSSEHMCMSCYTAGSCVTHHPLRQCDTTSLKLTAASNELLNVSEPLMLRHNVVSC